MKIPLYPLKYYFAPIKKKIYLLSTLMKINPLLLILEIELKLNLDAELDLFYNTLKILKESFLLTKLFSLKMFMFGKLIFENKLLRDQFF
jgi:hypothetical protein